MKERLKNFWKRNGFTTVFMSALVIVLSMSGIAGYRSAKQNPKTVENAEEFAQAEQKVIETKLNEAFEVSEVANAEVAESFGEDTKILKPTEGDVLMPYSMDTTIYHETLDQYKCHPAMRIKADENQEVVAAYGGKVSSITEDHVNGTMITVDMENGYQAVYGQMQDICVKEGDTIVKGQAMGKVAKPTGYFSQEGSHLYFGLTKDDVPVNPQEFMEK